MKYKVGDKVRIRDDLKEDEDYWMEDRSRHNCVNDEMIKLRSQICTIKSITSGGEYKLEEDPGDWFWVDGMFEGKVEDQDPLLKKMEWLYRNVSYGAFTEPKTKTTKELVKEIVNRRTAREWQMWDEWKNSRECFVWTTGDGETILLSGMETEHIKNALALLKRANNPQVIKDGVSQSTWIEVFEKELKYREWKISMNAIYGKKQVEAYCKHDIESMLRLQKENKENKENIKMTNTELIENKLEKELDALRKARAKEIKDKFYETPIGKAAKAFNDAVEQYGNESQKENNLIDEDDLLERGEEKFINEINDKYDAKCEEIREYYREALGLFENADTYEQKHEILTSYGILKGPKTAKAKVEVK